MKSYLILLSFLAGCNLFGQCPNSGTSITLTSQSEIDAFVLDYPNCVELNNSLTIGHSGAPMSTDIDDLSGFSPLRRVNGTLRVRNVDLLETFEGLHNIEYVAGDLIIGDNELLKNLTDFKHIDSIGRTFDIYSNPNLELLFEEDSISYVGESLIIIDNDNLTNISGFNELQSIGENLELADNDALSSTQGFENIETINGTLDIYNSPNLIDLNGFENLTFVNNGMEIRGTGITDFTGLNSLNTINGRLLGNSVSITNNLNLNSLNGLEELDTIQRSLFIKDNPELQSMEALSNLKYIGQQFSIENSSLSDISALNGIAPLKSRVQIIANPNLTRIDELPIASKIEGSLEIEDNISLISITAVSVLDTILGQLNVHNNISLTDCNSLCSLLRNGFIESLIIIRDNLGSCQNEDILSLACTTSTQNESKLNYIRLFPNPTPNILGIETFSPIQSAAIFRTDGALEKKYRYNHNPTNIELDVTDFEPGLYYLKLTIDERGLVSKFLKL